MKKMNREEAIALVGADAVNKVESKNCNYTNRNTEDGYTEFSASVPAIADGEEGTLVAYYYQDSDAAQAVENLDELAWEISHYEFVW